MVNIPWRRRPKHDHDEKHFHKLVPLAENPCDGADYASAVFAQRHEANPDELCFDLFFVANLATFTAYHTVDDGASLAAYAGFFSILWATWFQVTLHDVRFARDSVYERACKTLQFVTFVGLALAGSKFEPVENARAAREGKTPAGENANFRLLCWVLVLSRAQLAVQYAFVLAAVARRRFSNLYLPLALNTGVYAAAATAFGLMAPAFQEGGHAKPGVYWVWWVVLFVEGVSTVAISCIWRMLSFKKTHLVERMGLLTLIVIGEGAIGVTKTVSKMMGKSGVDWQGTMLVACIVLTLVFLFLTYFDNQPHGHYGTIRQQIWALLHFPFQLAVVGIGEGSQQIALARYIMNSIDKLETSIVEYCVDDALEGDKLVDKLTAKIKYFQLYKKPECYRQVLEIDAALSALRNATGICTAAATSNLPTTDWAHDYPRDFETLVTKVGSGITMAAGMKIAPEKEPWEVMQHSWRVVYIYYWSALMALFACLIAFLVLTRARRARIDLVDMTSVGGRVCMFAMCVFWGCAGMVASPSDPGDWAVGTDHTHNEELYRKFLSAGMVLPAGTMMLGCALGMDHCARALCNWRLRRQGYEEAPLLDSPGEHSGSGEDEHEMHAARPGARHSQHGSLGGASHEKLILAGEVDDVDEVLKQRRVMVRESKALGFRRQETPRPSSAIYLLGSFAAGLSNVRDVEAGHHHDQHHDRQQQQNQGRQSGEDGNLRRASSNATTNLGEPQERPATGYFGRKGEHY